MSGRGTRPGRTLSRATGGFVGLAVLVGPASAHSGTTHAGTPHWLLLVLAVLGVATMAAAVLAARREALARPVAGTALALGAAVAVFGGIGLVELQVVGEDPPEIVDVYPLLSLLVSGAVALGGFGYVRLRHPEKPRYAVLAVVLAAWIGYPGIVANTYTNPLGYLVVLSLPAVLGYVVWTDARGVLQSCAWKRSRRSSAPPRAC